MVPRSTSLSASGPNTLSIKLTWSTLFALSIILLSVVAKSIKFSESLPILREALYTEVIVVCAAVIAMSLAFAVMPSPPTTVNVLFAEISPPPVNPSPAVRVTEVWFMCSLAT